MQGSSTQWKQGQSRSQSSGETHIELVKERLTKVKVSEFVFQIPSYDQRSVGFLEETLGEGERDLVLFRADLVIFYT